MKTKLVVRKIQYIEMIAESLMKSHKLSGNSLWHIVQEDY